MKKLFNAMVLVVFIVALAFNVKAIDQIDGSTDFVLKAPVALAHNSVQCYGDYGRMGSDVLLVCYGNLSEEGFDYCFTITDGSNGSNLDTCDEDPGPID